MELSKQGDNLLNKANFNTERVIKSRSYNNEMGL
jgi:hypothetical protein